ncbi:MAG: dihydrofolate reductase [Nitrosomonadaceae bacterium]|nr:dihydrofolate reductase [Pseudomonadota bacterium]
MKPKIALIAIVAPGNIIGYENEMPWHLPRDLLYFRRKTLWHPVIMGRKTFESLKCKALPNRRNIVVTRNLEYTAPDCEVVHSLKEAFDISSNINRIFIIGGGQLYATAISLADEIYLTKIENKNKNRTGELFELFRGDTFFPEINELEWRIVHQGRPYIATRKTQYPDQKKHIGFYFRHIKYIRISKKENTEIIASKAK